MDTIQKTPDRARPLPGFLRQVVMTLAGRIVVGGSGLLGGVIVARYLGAEGVGVIAAIAVMNLLAVTICGFGLASSITYLVARGPTEPAAVVRTAIVYALVVGSFAAFLLIGAANAMPSLFGGVPFELIAIAAFAVPFQMLLQFSLAVFLGIRRVEGYNILDVLSQSFLVINPLIILVLLGGALRELVSLNAAIFAVMGTTAALLVTAVIRRKGGDQGRREPVLRQLLENGSRFFIATAASLIILRADLLIVNYFRGPSEAGVYGVSTQVGMLLLMVPNVISTVLFPKLAHERDDNGKTTCRVTRHTTLILFLLCLVAGPLAFVLPLFYGDAFSQVPWQVLILLPGVFLIGIESVQVQYFSGLGLPKAIPIFWICVLVANLFLNIVFVPVFGALAAAVVSTLSYGTMLVLVTSYFRRITGRTLGEIFVIGRDEIRDLYGRGPFAPRV